jgi:hypothetical protein
VYVRHQVAIQCIMLSGGPLRLPRASREWVLRCSMAKPWAASIAGTWAITSGSPPRSRQLAAVAATARSKAGRRGAIVIEV